VQLPKADRFCGVEFAFARLGDDAQGADDPG
jgi:hypothetical protein